MNRVLGLLSFILIATSFVACKRNDDEPILPPTRISRLYVSFTDVPPDDLAPPVKSIAVFDPADSLTLSTPDYFASGVDVGAGIYFNPFAKRVFQGSQANFMIKTFSVNIAGVLGPASSFVDSTLVGQPSLAYDHISTNLYVANNSNNSIHAYSRATQLNGIQKIGPKRFILNAQPRGLVLDNDSIMVVLKSEAVNEIALLENPSQIDSGVVNSFKKITITGASDLRGIAYSSKLNLIVVSDVVNSAIYFIENAREAFTQNSVVTTAGSLTGALTQINGPIDIAIDDRDDKLLLYVADRGKEGQNKKAILRFNLADRGNIAPQVVYPLTLNPASIYLDAR